MRRRCAAGYNGRVTNQSLTGRHLLAYSSRGPHEHQEHPYGERESLVFGNESEWHSAIQAQTALV